MGTFLLEAAIEAREPLRGKFFLDTEKRKTHARDAAWASGASELAPSNESDVQKVMIFLQVRQRTATRSPTGRTVFRPQAQTATARMIPE